jgi:hypothetical protein
MYSFWDYLGGAIVFGLLVLPLLGAVVIQAFVFLVAMFGGAMGFGTDRSGERTISVKVRSYDQDEDR